MTVTYSPLNWLDDQTCELTWSSSISGATFYIWRDGEFISQTAATSQQFRTVPGEYLLVDVFDSPTDSPDYAQAGRVHLCWYASPLAASYLVQEFVGAVWVDRQSIPDNGEGFFRFLTRYLEDGESVDFQVLAIDAAGNSATPAPFPVVQVRHPEIPDVEYEYDSGTGVVTITENP